jgi:hypothetical protein
VTDSDCTSVCVWNMVLQVKQEAIIWPHCEGERCAGKLTNEYTTI